MASSDANIADLTDSQQIALGTYTSVTNQDTAEAIALLRRSEWNVQIAIAKFFDGETADPVAEARASLPEVPAPQSRQSATLLDGANFPDRRAHLQRDPAPRVVPHPPRARIWRPPLIIQILLSPFNLLTRLAGNTLSFLGWLLTFVPGISRRGLARRAITTGVSPQDAAVQLAKDLDKAYGLGNLTLFKESYAQAYDLAKKDFKYLLVILISLEHEDTPAFVRYTLRSSQVVEFINDPQNRIVLWVGNVQDSEAYQVSVGLNCAKFPFAGLIVHTPQDSSTAMSIIARVSGLQPADTLISQLRGAIKLHTPTLKQAQNARNEQQAARDLREEQNSAYERSLAQDRERARVRREAEAAQKLAQENAKAKAAKAKTQTELSRQWRQWRAQSIAPEPATDSKDMTRISVRMTTGERLVRRFAAQANLEEVYAFVECLREISEPSIEASKPSGYDHEYRFRLVSPMPRTVYDVKASGTLGHNIGRSGNLVVEPFDDDEDEE